MRRAIILFLFLSLLSGCGYYKEARRDYVGYYQVNWTDDGALISSKRESRVNFGGDEDGGDEIARETQQLVKIDPINFTETTVLEIPWTDEISSIGGFGTTNLVAYLIRRNHLKIFKNGELKQAGAITSLFRFPHIVWSPNKQHFAISVSDDKFFIYDSNGTLIRERNEGGTVIWKNNQDLFFYNRISQKAAVYNITSDTVTILNHDIHPDFYNQENNQILSVKNGILFTYNLGANSITTKTLSYDFSSLDAHYFSPDGTKLALSKKMVYQVSSNRPYQYDQPSFGIYLYDLQTDVLTKVRD